MSDARKVLKKIGGRKKSSSRRRSPRKNRSNKRERWEQTALAILIAAVLIFAAYHLFFKKLFFRFAENKVTTQLQIPTGIYGIDISRYQGKIDWEELKRNNPKETPIYFVYMKASEGKDLRDPKFKSNWKKAKKHGFMRGAYHYFTEGSTGSMQANMFIKNVTLEKGDLPPMVDVEEVPKDKEAFNIELKGLILALEGHYGIKPIIYSSPEYRKKYLDDKFYDNYPYWVAHYYVDKPDTDRWDIWQYTDNEDIPGIDHKVDMNLFNGNLDKLKGMTVK